LKEKAVTKNPSTELHVRRPLNRAPTHPGEFFREILEEHLRLSISEAVSRMGISRQSLHAVCAARLQSPPTLWRPCAHCLFAATDRSACAARAVKDRRRAV